LSEVHNKPRGKAKMTWFLHIPRIRKENPNLNIYKVHGITKFGSKKRVKFEHPPAIVNLTSQSIQLSIICPSIHPSISPSLSLCLAGWPFKGGKKRKEKKSTE